MIRFNIKKMIADKEFNENCKITLKDLAKITGISRVTLGQIANKKGYSTSTNNIEKLCKYFNCTPNDLISIYPDEKPE